MKLKNTVMRKALLLGIFLALGMGKVMSAYAEESGVISGPVYHKHTGSSGKKGGCYQKAYTTTQDVKVYCSGTMVYYASYGTSGCNVCGAAYTGDRGGQKCQKYTTKQEKKTAYKRDCGKETTDIIGTLSLKKSTEEWTKSLTLLGAYETNGMTVTETPYVWNGVASANNSFEVHENNIYTLSLQADENADTSQSVLSMEVRNIDNTPPTIDSCKTESLEWTNKGTLVTVSAKDIQPDGSAGCGLSDTAFSYDGGINWVENTDFLYEKNGTYKVGVRDKLGNVTTKDVLIKNIDKLGPTIQKTEYDTGKNIAATTLTIEAEDLQEDGSRGCGLAKEAYSFDGGKNFSSSNVCAVKQNGIVNVVVKDALGNITTQKIRIGNIDDVPPTVTFVMNPSGWTNRPVTVSVQVKDLNPDGSVGVGLPVNMISYDEGKNWGNATSGTFTKNGSRRVTCRDLYDNYITKTVTVENIDTTPPEVLLSFQKETAKTGRLVATIKDRESGAHETAYSWDGGVTFCAEGVKNITQNGTYTVSVRDKAGNVNTGSIKISSLAEGEAPVLPTSTPTVPEETETESETEPETVTETDTEPEHTQTQEEELIEETTWEESTEEATETEAAVAMEELLAEPHTESVKSLRKNSNEGVILTVSLCMVALLAFLGFLFLWYHTIAVYCKEEEERVDFLGRIWIGVKDGAYEANITEHIWQQCTTTYFCFKPSKLFRMLHEGEEIIFTFPDNRWVSLPVEEKMETELL